MFSTFIENVSDKCEENVWTDSTERKQFVHKDLPPENGFRGFEKLPRVLCGRIDITPYLVSQKTKNIILKSKNSIANPDIKMFLQPCSVILVRENLENLKTLYNNNLINNKNNLLNTSPNLKKCKHCEKIYSSEKRLRNHVDSKHRVVYKTESKPLKRVSFSNQVIVHELKEYHQCRKCPKVYEDYQSLKIHMKQAHKKRKCYICFYCNKGFVDRMFFKVHIKMHCNLCGKFFVSKKKYNEHRRIVCRILKRYPCKNCNEVYFSYLSLKDHSFSHEGIIFVCDICKERFSSKCPLLHHIQFLHCKKHPKTLYDTVHVGTDIMYECNSCEQCSNSKDIMENHTTMLPDLKNCITTGYKDYYFCDQCSEQFDTETKMLRHKWTHFLKANENCKECVTTKKESFKMTYKVGEELPLLLQPKLVLTRLNIFSYLRSSLSKKINIGNEASTYSEASSPITATNINTGNGASTYLEASSPITATNINNNNQDITATNINNNNQEIIPVLKPDDLKSLISSIPKKAIVDPVSKKTLFSKHQCQYCSAYLSNGYCLRRHIQAVHMRSQNLQCGNCEEIFVSSALLQSHNCIRMNIPEMPFDDARPEIQFDNLHEFYPNINSQTPMDEIDFELPAPIVELTEFDDLNLVVNNEGTVSYNSVKTLDTLRYKITLQEVPIEF